MADIKVTSTDIKAKHILGWNWTWITVTFFMLIARLYIRVYLRHNFNASLFSLRGLRFILSDLFVLFAWITWLSYVATQTKLAVVGGYDFRRVLNWRPDELVFGNKIQVFALPLYFTVLYAVKASMLCFYNEIVPKSLYKTWLAVRVIGGLVVLCWLYDVLLCFLWCTPLWRQWTLDPKLHCSYSGKIVITTTLIPHITTDILIYFIPIIPLYYMKNITTGQKIGAIVMFSVGFVSVICAFLGFFIQRLAIGTPWNKLMWRQFLIQVELATAVTVSCCPAFKAVVVLSWRKLFIRRRNTIVTSAGTGSSQSSIRSSEFEKYKDPEM